MKLIKIEHYRYGEYDEGLYMWAPNDRDEGTIEADLMSAQKEYLKDLKDKSDTKELGPEPIRLDCTASKYDDKITVKQIKEMVNKRDLEIKEWREKNNARLKPFIYYMTKRGYKDFYDPEESEVIVKYVDWGHRHGQVIKYE